MSGPLEKITAFHAGPFVGLFVGTMESGSNCAQFIRLDLHEAAVAAARVEGMRSGIEVAASLAAAISLLERGGKAAKKAAASDTMFDQMLTDYRKSLTEWRAEYAEASK